MAKNDTLRERLEALTRDDAAPSPENIAAMSPAEIQQIIYELRVHQIELEMQNDELRRTQAELDAAQARYFDLYDLAPVGYITVSKPGLILEANLTATTLLGVARRVIRGVRAAPLMFSQFILKEDRDLYFQRRQQLFETGEPQACDLRLAHEGDLDFWVHLEATATHAADGAPVLRVVLIDITERKQAEAALRESESLYQSLVAVSPLSICRKDLTGRFTFANQRFLEASNQSLANLIGKTDFDLHPPELAEKYQGDDRAVMDSGQAREFIEEHALLDGEAAIMQCYKTPIYDAAGNINGVQISFWDITDRQRTEDALRASEAKNHALVDALPDLLFVQSRAGVYLDYHAPQAQLLLAPPEIFLDKNMRDILPPQISEDFFQVFDQARQTGRSQLYEYALDLPDGPHYFESHVVAYQTDNFLSIIRDITDRKQAEAALLASERRSRQQAAELQTIMDAVPAAVWIAHDQLSQVVTGNRAAYKRLRLPPGHNASLTSPDGQRLSHSRIYQNGVELLPNDLPIQISAATGVEICDFEEEIVFDDGTIVYELGDVMPLFDEAGQPRGAVGVFIDITARKQAEEALRKSERQLLFITGNVPAIVSYVNAQDLRYRFINRAGVDLLGISLEYPVGKRVSEILGEAAFARAEPYIERARAGERIVYESHHLMRGEQRWFITSYTPEFDAQGAVENIIILGVDITERKQAAEQLQRYAFIANTATESMTLINRQHVFESVNDAYCHAQGRSRAELIGHSLAEVWGAARYGEKIRPHLEQCFAGQIMHYEDTFPFNGGEPRHYEMGMYPYSVTPDGPVTYVIIVTFDITERKRAENTLRELNAELQIRNEELDAFAQTVAHDLKGPLGVMMAYAELLVGDYGALSTDTIQQSLAAIGRTGRKANDIIGSLLMLASVRKQDVVAAPLNMARLIDEAMLRLIDPIHASGADFHVPDRDGWPVALGHAPWIEEIWANYLSNALKYGGPQPRIELSATRQPDGFIRFSVRDYGPGLTLEQQQRLFAPFERLGQASVKGHGLGLSVVRRITDKLGGQAGVISQPGQGSAFYFTLPAGPDLDL